MFAPRAGSHLTLFFLLAVVLLLAAVRDPPLAADLEVVALALAVLGSFLAVFFRDPERPVGAGIVAPADGRVVEILTEDRFVRIAVFMSVTDVHVNRFPMDARVRAVGEGGHGHAPAYRPHARGNVQRSYYLTTSVGEVEVVQITGVLARRLVSFVQSGEERRRGSRLGMIVLGSRVDLILPASRVTVIARVGDRVRAGVTPLAEAHA
ncbi:MAG: phosphatidylserine decarboxylase [Thermoplasmata archaeon]